LWNKCFKVFFSLFPISGIFYFILDSLIYSLPIFKVSKKSGCGKILGLYGTGGCTINTLNSPLYNKDKLILKTSWKRIFRLVFVFRWGFWYTRIIKNICYIKQNVLLKEKGIWRGLDFMLSIDQEKYPSSKTSIYYYLWARK
jgi:hypothetical protein